MGCIATHEGVHSNFRWNIRLLNGLNGLLTHLHQNCVLQYEIISDWISVAGYIPLRVNKAFKQRYLWIMWYVYLFIVSEEIRVTDVRSLVDDLRYTNNLIVGILNW